jgi:hypothetical protein
MFDELIALDLDDPAFIQSGALVLEKTPVFDFPQRNAVHHRQDIVKLFRSLQEQSGSGLSRIGHIFSPCLILSEFCCFNPDIENTDLNPKIQPSRHLPAKSQIQYGNQVENGFAVLVTIHQTALPVFKINAKLPFKRLFPQIA